MKALPQSAVGSTNSSRYNLTTRQPDQKAGDCRLLQIDWNLPQPPTRTADLDERGRSSRARLRDGRYLRGIDSLRRKSGSKGDAAMKLARRDFLQVVVAGAAALPAALRAARAQAYPARPVRIVVGFPAGGAPGCALRASSRNGCRSILVSHLSSKIDRAPAPISRPTVAHAAADGYTLLLVVNANTVNVTLYDKLSFDFPARHRAGGKP